MSAHIEDAIAREVAEHGAVRPPWARYPEIPCGSIGWRMGAGEDWMQVWWTWLERHRRTESETRAYLRRHPAPWTWAHAVVSLFDEQDESDPDANLYPDAGRIADLVDAGVLADDVSYPAWREQQGGDPHAPWDRFGSLHTAQRYGSRALYFLGRWAAEHRGSRVLTSWLEAHQGPRVEWEPFLDALVTGRLPSNTTGHARESVTLGIAAGGGYPRAPWTRGDLASSLTESFDGDVSYADAWWLWAFDSIEDPPTWERYLDSQRPVPAEWNEVLRSALAHLHRVQAT